jgi:hypothetical protein
MLLGFWQQSNYLNKTEKEPEELYYRANHLSAMVKTN